jgi:hypothetical protein
LNRNVIDDVERVSVKLSEHLADEPADACISALSLLLAIAIRDLPASKQERVFRRMVELMADDIGL